MKKVPILLLLLSLMAASLPTAAFCQDAGTDSEVYDAGQIQVTAKGERRQVVVDPQKSTIRLDDYQSVGMPQNVGDIVKDMVIIDYRGATDLVPDDDTLYMRGFSSKRFVTALDGSTIRKTGGRRSSHIVDYALLPPFLIESVDVLPGPHSALYPGKSIGGVVDFKTKSPRLQKTLKPKINLSASYGTYDTRNHTASVQGSVGNFTYDMGFQRYATNGYLRHNEADMDTFFGRLGYILPNDGYISFTASYADMDRERPVINDRDNPECDYDSSYPDVPKEGRIYYDWQDPTWDKHSPNFRLNLKLPTALGTWMANACYGEEDRDNAKWDWVDPKDHSRGIYHDSWITEWRQQGGGIANEFQLAEGHVTTVGMEMVQCYDGYDDEGGADKKRIENMAGFVQHEWAVLPRLTLTAGLRYVDHTIWVGNETDGGLYITGEDDYIRRDWSQWTPKSFLTYELDDLAGFLRDTSISAGVSRIWRAPDYHGDYNPQGKPAGAWLDPEHGVAYDFVLNRRLAGAIQMKFNYAYYVIEDYLADNADPDYGDRRGKIPGYVRPGEEYKDYHVNLEKITREGVELQLSGHLTDDLYFLLGYAWQDFDYDGKKYPDTARQELAERADYFVTARLTWQLSEATSVTLDYEYQDDQVAETVEVIDDDLDIYQINRTEIDAFDLVNLSLKHILFEKWHGIKKGVLRVYAKNLLNEDYLNTSAYPGTDFTVGAGISLEL